MTNFLLFLILVLLAVISFQIRAVIAILETRNDFTNEDTSVKASTEEVKKAKGRLPKQQEN